MVGGGCGPGIEGDRQEMSEVAQGKLRVGKGAGWRGVKKRTGGERGGRQSEELRSGEDQARRSGRDSYRVGGGQRQGRGSGQMADGCRDLGPLSGRRGQLRSG